MTLLANSVTFSTVEPMISEYRGQDVFLGPKYLLSYIHNLRIRATSIEEKMTGLEVSLIRSFKKNYYTGMNTYHPVVSVC